MVTPPEETFPEDVARFDARWVSGMNIIGRGGQATIYKGSFGTHKNVVTKIWTADQPQKKDQVTEVNLLRRSHHQNVVRFFGIVVDNENIVGYVTEFMENGDLSQTIHNDKFIYTPGLDISWITQAACAIQYLHEKKVAHRDIKPLNMLLTNHFRTLKLCDYGLSKDYSQPYSITIGALGTYWYMPPEKLLNEGLTTTEYPFATDIYSFSISIWQIITRERPYGGENSFAELYKKVGEGHLRPNIELIKMDDVKKLLENGWTRSPEKRPPIEEFVRLFEVKQEQYPKETAHILIGTEEAPRVRGASKEVLTEKVLASMVLRWDTTNIEINEAIATILYIHDNITFVETGGIVLKDAESLVEVKEMYTKICQTVMEQFKEFSKKTIEQVWAVVTLEEIKGFLDDYNKKYDSIKKLEVSQFSQSLVFDWSDLAKWHQETVKFAEDRKEFWHEIQKFSASCKALTEGFNSLFSNLENPEYSKKADELVGLVDSFRMLEQQQKNNENMFMIYTLGELHDRLSESRNVIGQIDQRFSELVIDCQKKLDETAKDLDAYSMFCRQLSNAATVVDDSSIELLLGDISEEKRKIVIKWSAFKSACQKLAELKIDVATDVKTRQCVSEVRVKLKELEEMHEAVRKSHQMVGNINKLNESLSTFSLLSKENNVEKIVDFQKRGTQLNEQLEAEKKKIFPDTVLSFPSHIPFSQQLEQHLDKKVNMIQQAVAEVIAMNKKLLQIVTVYA